MANVGICTEAAGNNCGVYSNTPNLRTVNWGREDSGVQSEPEVVGAGPQMGGMKQCQKIGGFFMESDWQVGTEEI